MNSQLLPARKRCFQQPSVHPCLYCHHEPVCYARAQYRRCHCYSILLYWTVHPSPCKVYNFGFTKRLSTKSDSNYQYLLLKVVAAVIVRISIDRCLGIATEGSVLFYFAIAIACRAGPALLNIHQEYIIHCRQTGK